MKNLPPPPPDVLLVTAEWDVNGDIVSNGWWLFAPGADFATPLQLESLLGNFFFGPIGELLPRLSTDTSCSLLSCATRPAVGLDVAFQPSFNAGALDGTTPLNAALVLTWRTQEPRLRSHAHSWLPLSRSNLGADKRRLSPLGYAEGSAAARRFMIACNALASPDGATCVLMELHRARAGAPLTHALMTPIVDGVASPVVGTLRRRTRTAPRSPSAP